MAVSSTGKQAASTNGRQTISDRGLPIGGLSRIANPVVDGEAGNDKTETRVQC